MSVKTMVVVPRPNASRVPDPVSDSIDVKRSDSVRVSLHRERSPLG